MLTLLIVTAVGLVLATYLGDRAARLEFGTARLARAVVGASSVALGCTAVALLASGHMALSGISCQTAAAQEVDGQAQDDQVDEKVQAEKPLDADAGKQDAAAKAEQSATPPEKQAEQPINDDAVDAADTVEPVVEDSSKADADQDDQIPLSTPIVDLASRPDWVDKRPFWVGGVRCIPISSGAEQQRYDCDKQLALAAETAIKDYINSTLQHRNAATFIKYDPEYLVAKLVKEENYYLEDINPSFGTKHQQVHALLEIQPWFRADVEQRWHDVLATSRLIATGFIAGGVLMLVGVMFTYFKLDTATRGFYTGRLQFATAVAILVIIAAGVLLSRSITWM